MTIISYTNRDPVEYRDLEWGCVFTLLDDRELSPNAPIYMKACDDSGRTITISLRTGKAVTNRDDECENPLCNISYSTYLYDMRCGK